MNLCPLLFMPSSNIRILSRTRDFRSPTVSEMVDAYQRVMAAGLVRVRLGNIGVLVRTDEDQGFLLAHGSFPD
jgi:hypothetical protein